MFIGYIHIYGMYLRMCLQCVSVFVCIYILRPRGGSQDTPEEHLTWSQQQSVKAYCNFPSPRTGSLVSQSHQIMEQASQKRSRRILKANIWLYTGPPKNQILCLRTLLKHFLNLNRPIAMVCGAPMEPICNHPRFLSWDEPHTGEHLRPTITASHPLQQVDLYCSQCCVFISLFSSSSGNSNTFQDVWFPLQPSHRSTDSIHSEVLVSVGLGRHCLREIELCDKVLLLHLFIIGLSPVWGHITTSILCHLPNN